MSSDFCLCCRNHVLLEDVEYFLDKSKAKECFEMLDLDKDGKVSLQVTSVTLRHKFMPCLAAFEVPR